MSNASKTSEEDRTLPIIKQFQALLPKELELTIHGNYKLGFSLSWNAKEQFGPDCAYDILKLISQFFEPGSIFSANRIGQHSGNPKTWIWDSEKQVYNVLNKFFPKNIVKDANNDWQDRRPMEFVRTV